MKNLSTPKTLQEAIGNGIREATLNGSSNSGKHIEAHVKDFLAQRFGAAMLQEQPVKDLWQSLFPKEKP